MISTLSFFFRLNAQLTFSSQLMLVKNYLNHFRISGLFEFRRPVVLIKDPQIIKQLTVKDFDHFTDHRVVITEDMDPLFGKTLLNLRGQKWKDMRATLSPAFTGEFLVQI